MEVQRCRPTAGCRDEEEEEEGGGGASSEEGLAPEADLSPGDSFSDDEEEESPSSL